MGRDIDESREILAKKIFINNNRARRRPRVEKESSEDEKKSKGNSVFIAIVVLVMAILTLQYLSEFYDYNFDEFTKKYEILGLEASEETTVQEIKKSYRKLALECERHPDKNPGCEECAEKYRVLSDAYDFIINHREKFWKKYREQVETLKEKPKPAKSKPQGKGKNLKT